MGDHYFSENAAVASRPQQVDLVLPDLHMRLTTDRGMFSPDRVDPGTRILLESVPPPPQHGELLDLGCGYGPIALTMARRALSARVWGVDVNRRALEVARHNARGLYNVDFLVGDDLDPGLRFAGIWSNPPIRIGKAALHTLLSTWLARLAPGAIAHLVVARNLGADSLQGWLIEHGWPSRRIASRSGYRVLAVESATGAQTEEERR